MTSESRFRLAPHARFRRVGDEGVIVDQQTAEVLVVNAVAARFLERSMSGGTIAQCAAELSREFEATAGAIEADLLTFARELHASGLGTTDAA